MSGRRLAAGRMGALVSAAASPRARTRCASTCGRTCPSSTPRSGARHRSPCPRPPAELYPRYNPSTVDRHFRWMREYDLPGVFLQRFTVRLDNPAVRGFRDRVARNVRAAAESHGRVFALMYDISGHPRETSSTT